MVELSLNRVLSTTPDIIKKELQLLFLLGRAKIFQNCCFYEISGRIFLKIEIATSFLGKRYNLKLMLPSA